jgi:hypothetical protein
MPFPSQDFYDAYKADIINIAEQIAYKFNICVSDVTSYVREILNNSENSSEQEIPQKKKEVKRKIIDDEEEQKEQPKEEVKKEVKKKGENPHEGKTCQHMMTSGKNKGNLCGDKVNSESKTGLYCKTHLKNEANNKFIQSSLPFDKKDEQEKKVEKKEEKKEEKKVAKKAAADKPLINNTAEIKNIIAERTNTISIKKNKTWNVYEHSATGLVLDQNTKEVVGKLNNETGVISELTSEDIDLAKTLGFKKIKVPDNLPSSKKSVKSELYDDDDDEEDDVSDVDDDGDEE